MIDVLLAVVFVGLAVWLGLREAKRRRAHAVNHLHQP
jgi:hypothetical protein